MAVLWDRLLVYRDEVASSAVDVNIVVIHSDHFVGLCHEEGSAAELRTLRGEGELTLHCDHVQAACQGVIHSACLYHQLDTTRPDLINIEITITVVFLYYAQKLSTYHTLLIKNGHN